MITQQGKQHLKRYFSGGVGSIARTISVGVGDRLPTEADTGMHFETVRADIDMSTYDYVEDRLIFKASLPSDYAGEIREIAIWSMPSDNRAGNFSSMNIVSFDSTTEPWTNPLYSSDNTRIGTDSLRLVAGPLTTQSATLDEVALNLSGYSNLDTFSIAFFASADTESVRFIFHTDFSNFYQFTVTPAVGYNIISVPKGDAVTNGTPNWETITSVEVSITAAGTGTSTVDFDGIRIEDVDALNPDYVMIARTVLETPVVKEAEKAQDIEFALTMTV